MNMEILKGLQLWLQISMYDEQYSKPYKSYFSENAIKKVWNDKINETEYFNRVIERGFNWFNTFNVIMIF